MTRNSMTLPGFVAVPLPLLLVMTMCLAAGTSLQAQRVRQIDPQPPRANDPDRQSLINDVRPEARRPKIVEQQPDAAVARGVVFVDEDRDGKLSPQDSRFAGVRVSNGRTIVKTNDQGEYEIPLEPGSAVFVIKPSGFQVPLNHAKLPQFYYLHKPDGSPKLRYPGSKPTGPLPQSINFPLHRKTESAEFKILLFGDPQPRDNKEVDYIAQDVVRDLVGSQEHAFGVTLGDIAFDNLSTFETLNQTIALIGIPWYNVIGNHDVNLDGTTRADINETFERVYGPSYYSFDHGQVHFVVMDNIDWAEPNERVKRRHYTPRFGKQQLEFLKQDLAMIPESQMVVLLMHVPIISVADREAVYRLIEKRPYCISISGHTHDHRHLFLDEEDGFRGEKPHHHIINVTVSGSWWSGAKNENGIPHTTMKDGAPNGYSVLTFDRDGYRMDFRAAGRPASDQLRIEMPTLVHTKRSKDTDVWVNVYNGSERSQVMMNIDGAEEWTTLEKREVADPYFVRLFERDKSEPRPLTSPKISSHLWYGQLPQLDPGVHLIVVKTIDRHGRTYTAHRSIRVSGTSTSDSEPANQ